MNAGFYSLSLTDQLYELMCAQGYPEDFSRSICRYMNTDYTAGRMIGYLSHYDLLPLEEVADELITILSDRQRFIEKAETEKANAAYTAFLNRDRSEEEE